MTGKQRNAAVKISIGRHGGGVNEGLDRYSHLHESLQGLRWKERERAEEEERRRPGRAAAAVKVYKLAKWSHTDGRTHTEGRL